MKASTIVNVLFVLAVALIIALVAITGIEKEEKVECYKLQAQAEEYPNFYVTDWQAEMCDSHGIEVSAPVK